MSTHQAYNEKELLIRIAEGDEAAFSILFGIYLGKLKPFVEKLVVSEDDTREIIQETFVRLWLSRDKLPHVEHPSAYIFRIAANQYHMYLRRRLSQERAVAGYEKTVQPMSDNTEHTLRLHELQRLVQDAISRLPEKRRIIFHMSRNEGMSIREIAATLNLSPKTVKNTLFTALGNIRQYLAAAGEAGWWLILLFLIR
ncbi:RNA polymerase sigma factor [Chitinophaga agrisoli]|uniref:RNA polymerase sigma factor n=1 Tax=Chitinophaga agrisoli TaxID=2607653 RepID=UPI001661B16D|nr:RNA polymerase sigma-70 factor [Chitinophaga agrisoli]